MSTEKAVVDSPVQVKKENEAGRRTADPDPDQEITQGKQAPCFLTFAPTITGLRNNQSHLHTYLLFR